MAVIYRYVGNDDDAKDVLQDTFIKAFESFHSFTWEGEGSLKAWLSRIAVNRSLNMLRSRKTITASPVPLESLGEPPDLIVEEPDAQEVSCIDISVIMDMVSQLPDGYRTVFNLYCIEGYNHYQIAEMLGISEKTSSSQLKRAKAILASKIKAFINEKNRE